MSETKVSVLAQWLAIKTYGAMKASTQHFTSTTNQPIRIKIQATKRKRKRKAKDKMIRSARNKKR